MMKKFGLLGLFLLVTIGGIGAYGWREFTKLPDWYTQNPSQEPEDNILNRDKFDDPEEITALEQKLAAKFRQGTHPSTATSAPAKTEHSRSSANNNPAIALDAQELNELVVVAAHQSQQAQPYLKGIQGIKTDIKNEQVQSEVVINLSKVDTQKLPAAQLKVIDQLQGQFPNIAQEDLLVSLAGQPQIKDGRLQLAPNTKIAIGGIQTTVADLSKRLGVEIGDKPIHLNVGDLAIADLQYQNDAVLIKRQ